MAVIRKHSKMILAFSLALSLGLFWFFLVDTSRGAPVTNRSDMMNNSDLSATSNHTIAFTVQNGLVSQACPSPPCFGTTSSTLSVTFPAGFNLTNLTCGDINMATGTAFLFNVASPESRTNCLNTGTSWGVAIDAVNKILTFTTPTSAAQYIPVTTGTQLTISIGSNATFQNQGTHWITNPSSAGTYTISVGGTFGGMGNMLAAINPPLQLSATVAETLTFSITGRTAGNCTADDGATVNAVDTAANAVPFGTLNANTFYQGCQDLAITTNAGSGYSVASQESSALHTAGGQTIPDATCDNGTCTTGAASGWVNANNSGFGHTCFNQVGNDCSPAYGNGTKFRPFADVAGGTAAGVSLVESTSTNLGGVSSGNLAFPSNNTAGDLIIAMVRHSGTGIRMSTVTDLQGNAYYTATSNVPLGGGITAFLSVYYAYGIKAGANTITFTVTGGTPGSLRPAIFEYAGVQNSGDPLDQFTSKFGNNNTITSGSVTTTIANELAFDAAAYDVAQPSITAGTNWILREFGSQLSGASEDQFLQTATSVNATFGNVSGTPSWASILATFRLAGGTGEVVMASSTPASATGRVKYRLSVGANQPAGTYTNLVSFIATPMF